MFRVDTDTDTDTDTETLLHESHQRRKPKTMEPKNEDEAEKNGFRNKRRFFERDPIFPGILEFYFPIGLGGAIAEVSNVMRIKHLFVAKLVSILYFQW